MFVGSREGRRAGRHGVNVKTEPSWYMKNLDSPSWSSDVPDGSSPTGTFYESVLNI